MSVAKASQILHEEWKNSFPVDFDKGGLKMYEKLVLTAMLKYDQRECISHVKGENGKCLNCRRTWDSVIGLIPV